MAFSDTLDKYGKALAALTAGQVAPVYCFHGPQRYLVGQLVEAVRKAVLKGRTASLNHDRFLADSTEPAVVADSLRTVPMMAEHRLAEVGNAEKWSAQQLAQLEPLLNAFPPHGCLMLTAENMDGRLKIVRQMASMGVVLKLETPDRRQLSAFLRRTAAGFGVELTPGASGALMELVGKDLGSLVSALQKASLYGGGRGKIREEHVQAVVADTRQAIIFELTDAVGGRALDKALAALRRLMAGREPAQRVLVMLARQVRLLWLARQAVDQGVSPGRLASHLDLHSFVAQKLAGQVGGFTPAELRAAHRAVARADRTLKRSRLDPQLVLEELLLRICARTSSVRT